MDIARASHACLRCRRQKKRCNRGIPKCSHCLRANAACRRETFISGSHIPVRTVSELEAEVARLELQIGSATGNGRPQPGRTPTTPGWTEDEIRGREETRDADDFLMPGHEIRATDDDDRELCPGPTTSRDEQAPNLGVLADLNNATVYDYDNYNLMHMLTSALMLENDVLDLRPGTRLRKPFALSNPQRDGGSLINHLPRDLLSSYLKRYFEHVDPTFPILAAGDVNTTLQRLGDETPVDPSEACLLYLALAIGGVFPSTDSLLDASVACQLWLAATKEQVFHDESENTVRILLLLALFSLLEEGCGSSWHLVELVVRTCIKLGLHSKTTEQTSISQRLPLFWSAYLLDRWVSCTLSLPVSIHNGEFDQQLPDLSLESDQPAWPTSLWHMAYGLGEGCAGPSNAQLEPSWLCEGFSQSVSSYPSKLLHNIIAGDLRVALAARYILREGGAAAERFDNIASDHLSAVESAVKRGYTLPWTVGCTAFVSVMIQLVSFGQLSRYRLLFAQKALDPAYIPRALNTLRALDRKFKSLESLGDVLYLLHQVGTAIAPVSRALLAKSCQGTSSLMHYRALPKLQSVCLDILASLRSHLTPSDPSASVSGCPITQMCSFENREPPRRCSPELVSGDISQLRRQLSLSLHELWLAVARDSALLKLGAQSDPLPLAIHAYLINRGLEYMGYIESKHITANRRARSGRLMPS